MRFRYWGALLGLSLAVPPAHATLVDGTASYVVIPAYAFQTSEDGTVNPSYTYTGASWTQTISFGPYLAGQTGSDPLSPPATVTGSPTAPLALTPNTDWQTVVELDNANNTEVLGGLPGGATYGFGGPIAIAFSTAVLGVQLVVGDLSAAGTTTIQGYSADGTSLGSVTNSGSGYETFNLTDDGGAPIGALLITSTELAGFGVNNLAVFGVPAPGALAVLPGSALLLAARMRRRRSATA
jgi:hypothetical protein